MKEIDISLGKLDALLASEKTKPREKSQSKQNNAPEATHDAQGVEHESWGGLLLPGAVRTPDIPAALLPGWAGAMVGAIAKDTQTPEAASVVLALSMIAACVQRRWEVAPGYGNGYTEPLCLWTLAALPSGSRKTAIVKALSAPLPRWEKLMGDRMRADIAGNDATRRVSKRRIEALEAKAAKADDKKARDSLREEIRIEIEMTPDEIYAPRLMTGDITPERAQDLLVEQRERISVISDEGGILQILGGAYSNGGAMNDVFLQGHSGSRLRVDRRGRTAHLESPAITFGLALQPGVLQDVANDKRFHDSGLLARFLFCIPHSTVGTRDVRARNPIPDDVSQAWHDGLHDLLVDAEKHCPKPRILPFTHDAREAWFDFAQKVEGELQSGGKLANLSDWGAKLPGQAARIAGLMQMVATGRPTECVELDAVQRAIELTGLLVKHAQAAFRLLGADQVEADAIVLLEWVKMRGADEFDRRSAQKALEGRFRTVQRLKEAAERLAEWNVLSNEIPRKNAGARPTIFYRVNHALFVDK